MRIDQFLVKKLPDLSRSNIQTMLKSGDILHNDTKVKAKQTVSSGDSIHITFPEPSSNEVLPQDIALHILYEDEDIIVINKQHGMVVHPASGNDDGTLVNALLFHCDGKLASDAGETRPGIVHRLDKDTSGCIIAAKTNIAYHSLCEQFAERTTEKRYLTVVQSPPTKKDGNISTNIGRHPVNRLKMAVLSEGSGKHSSTDFTVLHQAEDSTCLILCNLHTGRTHQIRVHMLHLGTPILGDPIYAKPARQTPQTGRLMLHAWQLVITHPVTLEKMSFQSPIPDEYQPWTMTSESQQTIELLSNL